MTRYQGTRGLHFNIADFIGSVPIKAMLANLPFLYCGEFVKNSIVIVIDL